MNFKDQTILITGGAQGIGLSLSKKFCSIGANVIIADKDRQTPDIAARIGVFGYVCDVTIEQEINNFITFAEEKFGQVDCFISNAGMIFVDPGHVAYKLGIKLAVACNATCLCCKKIVAGYVET